MPPPSTILDDFCKGTARAAEANYSKKKFRKDGWTPESQALLSASRILIIIIRHTDGCYRKNCSQWDKTNFQHGLKLLLTRWKSLIASLTKDPAERLKLRNISEYGYNYWVHASWRKLRLDAKPALKSIKNLLHGRKRKDRRLIQNERTAKIEKFREAARIGFAIRSLNKDKPPSFHMDELRLGDRLVTDPLEIAKAVLSNFMDWFKAKINPSAGNLSIPGTHWSKAEAPLDDFLASNTQTNIPTKLLTLLHTNLQRKPMDLTTLDTFQTEVMLPPTLVEFNNCIEHAPDHTAAGLSGLNYDCIKLWPMEVRARVLDLLNILWEKKTIPDSWKWRWLVPIPKCDNPQLSDLRPLVLIEAIRKIWTGIFVHRILTFLHKHSVLCANQHGFLWGKSTESASIILLNALETACEWRSRIFISSWDLKRAFDSVPTAMLVWSLIRIGIPTPLAEYLAQMDLDGYVVIRSPLTMAIHDKLGTEGLLDSNLHFTPNQGTGQGDKTSPLLWDAFCDILLCALADIKEGPFYFQDHLGSNHVTPDVGYADDVISIQGNTAALQAKADVISAFAIIMNMAVSITKLRLFGIQWGNHHRPSADHIIIHSLGWTPTSVPILQAGDLKHLGIIWGMDLLYLTQLQNAASLLSSWCKYAASSKLSLASKKLALEMATYQKIIYYARFASWDTAQLDSLDRIVGGFIRKIHKSVHSVPADLLFLPKQQGGLGYKRLSHEIYKAQFALFWRLMSSSGSSKLATLSCISRGYKAAGQLSPHCYGCPMEDPLSDRWWAHGIKDYLKLLDINLIRNGQTNTDAESWIGTNLSTEHRAVYSRLGIFSPNECYMEGDEHNIPLSFNLPPLPPSPTAPICLRPGQVWKQEDDTIWEILSIELEHAQIIYWQRMPNNLTLYLDENNFCLGSGSNNTLDKTHILNLCNCTLLTLDIEHHKRHGITTSNILFARPRKFYWPGLHTPSPLSSLLHILSDVNLPTTVRDIYTDGSWLTLGSAAKRILTNGKTMANGAIVLEDITERGPPQYFGIKLLGSIEHVKSAYTFELLSIALAALVAPHTNTTGCIRSDCISAIKTATNCWLRRGLYRTYPLIGAALNLTKSYRIAHVKAHPERKNLGGVWTDQDCGIYVADRTAGIPQCSTTKAGILDSTLLDILTLPLPYIYRDYTGEHVLEDLNDRYHRLMADRYLTKRDAYRLNDTINPRPAKWGGMNLKLMAHTTGTNKLNLSEGCSATHALFDWYYTGSNRIKNKPLADDTCYLCGASEDRRHILLHCPHPELKRLRADLLEEARGDITLLPPGPTCKAAWAIFTLLESNLGHQIMTSQLEPSLRAAIALNPDLNVPLSTYEWSPIDKILCKIGAAALHILRSHIRLTCWHINGKKLTGLVRTSIGIQRSITSSFNPAPLPPQPCDQPLPPLHSCSPNNTIQSPPTADTLSVVRLNRLVPSTEQPSIYDDTTASPDYDSSLASVPMINSPSNLWSTPTHSYNPSPPTPYYPPTLPSLPTPTQPTPHDLILPPSDTHSIHLMTIPSAPPTPPLPDLNPPIGPLRTTDPSPPESHTNKKRTCSSLLDTDPPTKRIAPPLPPLPPLIYPTPFVTNSTYWHHGHIPSSPLTTNIASPPLPYPTISPTISHPTHPPPPTNYDPPLTHTALLSNSDHFNPTDTHHPGPVSPCNQHSYTNPLPSDSPSHPLPPPPHPLPSSNHSLNQPPINHEPPTNFSQLIAPTLVVPPISTQPAAPTATTPDNTISPSQTFNISLLVPPLDPCSIPPSYPNPLAPTTPEADTIPLKRTHSPTDDSEPSPKRILTHEPTLTYPTIPTQPTSPYLTPFALTLVPTQPTILNDTSTSTNSSTSTALDNTTTATALNNTSTTPLSLLILLHSPLAPATTTSVNRPTAHPTVPPNMITEDPITLPPSNTNPNHHPHPWPGIPTPLLPATTIPYDTITTPTTIPPSHSKRPPETTALNEDDDDDEPPVKRRFCSRNIITDDLDMILLRRGRGTWRPRNPNNTREARINKKFMKSIRKERRPDG